MKSPLRVVHFQRRPFPSQVSIERLFTEVRRNLPAGIECHPRVCPHFSGGIFPRIANIRHAAAGQGEVNHVVGDSHYLVLGLDPHRTVLTIHDCAALDRLRGFKRQVLRRVWFDWPIRRARIVTAVSEATRRELLRLVPSAHPGIRVIHNCVGARFAPGPKPFNAVEPAILQVGTGGNKNLPRVAEALAGMRCRLLVIGPISAVQRQILSRCNIRHSNIPRATDDQVLQAFRDCDFLVFASTCEGFGLPIIEAQATGRPVVTSDVLSMPEVAGDAACFVDPFDPGSIRAGIEKVIRDRPYRERLVRGGFENVRRFSAPAIAAQYAGIYREIAGGTEPAGGGRAKAA